MYCNALEALAVDVLKEAPKLFEVLAIIFQPAPPCVKNALPDVLESRIDTRKQILRAFSDQRFVSLGQVTTNASDTTIICAKQQLIYKQETQTRRGKLKYLWAILFEHLRVRHIVEVHVSYCLWGHAFLYTRLEGFICTLENSHARDDKAQRTANLTSNVGPGKLCTYLLRLGIWPQSGHTNITVTFTLNT